MTQIPSVNFGQNNTLDTINNVVSSNISQPKNTRTQQDFYTDVQKVMSNGTYQNQNDAIKGVLSYANSKGVIYNGIDTNDIISQLDKKTKDKSLFQRFGETFKKRGEAGAGIITRGVKGETGAIEGGVLFGMNFLGTLADLTGDAIAEAFTELDQFGDEGSMEKVLKDGIVKLGETSPGNFVFSKLSQASKNLEDLKKLDPVKGARFQGVLDLVNGVLTLAGGQTAKQGVNQTGKITKEIIETAEKQIKKGIDTGTDKIQNTITAIKQPSDDGLLKTLNLETVKGKIGDIEVDIPKLEKTKIDKFTDLFINKTEKELAGRAVSPRTIGKNAKQKLNSITEVEKNTRKFYENIRTGALEGDIDTLETAAQTIVNNIDIVGERIGNAVKKVDGVIEIDNKLTDDMVKALYTKGSEVSPATTVLKKFYDSLGDGKLSISEAYELKKAYSNEVTKLYKAGDAGTLQYKALSDGVNFLNTKIDDIIENSLGLDFAKDKELYRSLKLLVDDIVSSALVEGRKSPNGLAERIGMIESIFSPVNSVKQKLIKTVDEANTRGGAWKKLIEKYDEQSIKNAINN